MNKKKTTWELLEGAGLCTPGATRGRRKTCAFNVALANVQDQMRLANSPAAGILRTQPLIDRPGVQAVAPADQAIARPTRGTTAAEFDSEYWAKRRFNPQQIPVEAGPPKLDPTIGPQPPVAHDLPILGPDNGLLGPEDEPHELPLSMQGITPPAQCTGCEQWTPGCKLCE